MPTTITFRRGTAAPTQATGLTLGEPAFDSTNRNLYVGLGPGVTAAWVGARITGLSTDIAAGLTNWIVNAKAVNDYFTSLGAITPSTAVTWTALQTFTAGISAAGGITLASPNLTGTPLATTAAVGTNTTQIATTAFVNSEIIADAVTAFNGRTGSVQGVSAAVAGDGISVSGATGSVTFTNTGVTRAVAGTGISVSANTGTVTITNTGVLSFNGNTGVLQGVSAAVAGDGISVSGATGSVTITNSGVTRAVAGTGIGLNANTGTVTITNNGVQSFNGLTGAVTGASLGANTFTGLQTSATGFSGPLTGTATNASALGGTAASGWAQLAAANTFTALQTFNSGISAAGGITLNGPVRTSSTLSVAGAADVDRFTVDKGLTANGTSNFAQTASFNSASLGISAGRANIDSVYTTNIYPRSGSIVTLNGSSALTSANLRLQASDGVTDYFYTISSSLSPTASRTFTLPDASGTFALRDAANTFTGINTFNAGVTLASTLDVTGLAKFNGNVTVGDAASDVLTVTSGATFGITDHSGVARFAAGVTFSSTTDHAGVARFAAGITANTIDVSGTSRFTGDVSMGATLTVSGNLIVNGTTTTINSTTISVDDKNIVLGDIVSPTDAGADGGGFTLKGTTDKNFYWKQSNVGTGNTLDVGGAWNSDQNFNLASISGKFFIHQAEVLSKTALGSTVVSSSLTSVGTVTSGLWNSDIVYVDGGSY